MSYHDVCGAGGQVTEKSYQDLDREVLNETLHHQIEWQLEAELFDLKRESLNPLQCRFRPKN